MEAINIEGLMSEFEDFTEKLRDWMHTLNNNRIRMEVPNALEVQEKISEAFDASMESLVQYQTNKIAAEGNFKRDAANIIIYTRDI